MADDLELSLAVEPCDRTQPLFDGAVTPDGIDFRAFTYMSPERHRRMLKYAEFDVCELSFASYLASREHEAYEFTAIPVFPYRKFRHGYFFVNADAGIDDPRDLEGKRVGLRRWQNTAGLWMRGIARDYYGVATDDIDWYIDDEDEVPVTIPDRYAVHRIPQGQNVNDMLVAGDLDAALYPTAPSSFVEGSPAIERLFPDYKEEEIHYHQETDIFPIMHVVVIRDDVTHAHPWVPMNVRKAFEQAKRVALAELDHDQKLSILWVQLLLEEQREHLGWDLWPNTIEDNRNELETVIDYAVTDGLLSNAIDMEALFIPSSTESLPEYA